MWFHYDSKLRSWFKLVCPDLLLNVLLVRFRKRYNLIVWVCLNFSFIQICRVIVRLMLVIYVLIIVISLNMTTFILIFTIFMGIVKYTFITMIVLDLIGSVLTAIAFLALIIDTLNGISDLDLVSILTVTNCDKDDVPFPICIIVFGLGCFVEPEDTWKKHKINWHSKCFVKKRL